VTRKRQTRRLFRDAIFQPAIHTCNLLYHVCPTRDGDAWRCNVRQLVRRWGVFTGRRVVAVAYGPGLHDIDEVRAEFGRTATGLECFAIENDPELREVASFAALLAAVQSTDRYEATFYGHTKGTSRANGQALGAELWRNQMYASLLDEIHVVRHALLRVPAVGTFLMHWPRTQRSPYPSGLEHGNWMFAGTFFWFRHDAVFSRPDWAEVPRDRYGAEAWLGGLFDYRDVLSVHQPWPIDQYPWPSPYDPKLYRRPIRD
jgi:hypothetical protein